KYKVLYPGKPTLQQVQGQNNVQVHLTAVEGPNWAYTVNYYDSATPLPQTDEFAKKGLPQEAMGLFQGKGELKMHKFIKLQQKYHGIDYTGNFTKPFEAQVRGRSFIVGDRVYNVIVIGSAEMVRGETAQKFLDS